MGLIQQEPAVQKSTGTAAVYTLLYFWSVRIRSLFVSPLFVILIIAKADSRVLKPHRKCGDVSSPLLCHSISTLMFLIPSFPPLSSLNLSYPLRTTPLLSEPLLSSLHFLSFPFSDLEWNAHLPFQTCIAFCTLNHLLVSFVMMSSLLTWKALIEIWSHDGRVTSRTHQAYFWPAVSWYCVNVPCR